MEINMSEEQGWEKLQKKMFMKESKFARKNSLSLQFAIIHIPPSKEIAFRKWVNIGIHGNTGWRTVQRDTALRLFLKILFQLVKELQREW